MPVASVGSRVTLRATAYGCLRSQQMVPGLTHCFRHTTHSAPTSPPPSLRTHPASHSCSNPSVPPISRLVPTFIGPPPSIMNLRVPLSHVSEACCSRITMPTQLLTGKHRIIEWNSHCHLHCPVLCLCKASGKRLAGVNRSHSPPHPQGTDVRMAALVFVTTPHCMFDVFDMFCAEVFRGHFADKPLPRPESYTTAGS